MQYQGVYLSEAEGAMVKLRLFQPPRAWRAV